MSKSIIEIPPNGKRKQKIILEACFNNSQENKTKMEKELAYTMGRIGMFE